MSFEQFRIAKAFNSFALDGDLDAGLKLISDMNGVITGKSDSSDADNDAFEIAADEASYLAQKLEKGTLRLLRAGENA